MDKKRFLSELKAELEENGVADAEEILEEYETHFCYKMKDGYSESEIAEKLGAPSLIASQFGGSVRKPKNRGWAITGLIFADLPVLCFFLLLIGGGLAFIGVALATGGIGVCLLANISPYGWIPSMPYWCGALFALAFLALFVLIGVGCVYYGAFLRQLFRSYARFHRNILITAPLPSVAAYPEFSAKTRRRLRKITLTALAAFVVLFIAAYAVSALSAGAFEFWHVWNWFV